MTEKRKKIILDPDTDPDESQSLIFPKSNVSRPMQSYRPKKFHELHNFLSNLI